MFDQLIHADWSIKASKRWMATADREAGVWTVRAPQLVGPTDGLLDAAFAAAADGRHVLLGFDFPIGVPLAYGALTGLEDFRALLHVLDQGAWRDFFNVAWTSDQVNISRPFYPAGSPKGCRRVELVTALGVKDFNALLRQCERRTSDRPAASSLFWTVGGNQVGKAALSGWREIVLPALRQGAALWPFDGCLTDLATAPGVVLAETYPAEAYRMVGARFLRSESKTNQSHRAAKYQPVLAWSAGHSISFKAEAAARLEDGYGSKKSGEDPFDATMGLLKMIEVADRRRPERLEPATDDWEGWILGR